MDNKDLSERDICTKLIIPAIVGAGWKTRQFREEVQLTHGRVVVRGRLACRVSNPKATGGPKRADCVLYADNGIPIAVIEAKRNIHPLGHGMQQALYYAELLDAPFAISSNGDGFLLHDRTGITQPTERDLALDAFPSGSSRSPSTPTAVAKSRATTSASPSIAPSRLSPADSSAFSWSWPPEPARPTPHSRSSGVSGRPSGPGCLRRSGSWGQ
jgi:hypothetical protein